MLNLPVHFYYCDCLSVDVGNKRWTAEIKSKTKIARWLFPKGGRRSPERGKDSACIRAESRILLKHILRMADGSWLNLFLCPPYARNGRLICARAISSWVLSPLYLHSSTG